MNKNFQCYFFSEQQTVIITYGSDNSTHKNQESQIRSYEKMGELIDYLVIKIVNKYYDPSTKLTDIHNYLLVIIVDITENNVSHGE